VVWENRRLVAFQDFPAPPGGKKTGAVMENVFVLGYNIKKCLTHINFSRKTGFPAKADAKYDLCLWGRGHILFGGIRQEGYDTGAFDGFCQTALMFGAVAGNAAGQYFASFRNKFP
jgi:hypothetical protein